MASVTVPVMRPVGGGRNLIDWVSDSTAVLKEYCSAIVPAGVLDADGRRVALLTRVAADVAVSGDDAAVLVQLRLDVNLTGWC